MDTGIDDSMALLYLLAREVRISSRFSRPPATYPPRRSPPTIWQWLELCGRTAIEVAVGADGPLSVRAAHHRGHPRAAKASDTPSARPRTAPVGRSAADAWVELTRERHGEWSAS
ncbi:hypothetical protein GS421_11315 [Rhodococcus hoagii]|nr:hypothetical protein [Prescottella equi]